MKPIQVILVDDHSLVRAGLRVLLETGQGIEVVAEAGDGREAVRVVRAQSPDVVVMDIAMKGLNGLDATLQVVQACPRVRVLILSMHANEDYVFQALHNGAIGYLLKDVATAEFERAVRAVARGEVYLSPAVLTPAVSEYLQRRRRDAGKKREAPPALSHALTLRQREVLQLIAGSATTREIAQRLHLSVKTVETHRTQLMQRLNINNIAGLVRYAIRIELVDLD